MTSVDYKRVAKLLRDQSEFCDAEHIWHELQDAAKLCDRESLVQELIDACKHTKREPSGRVMRAVKALEDFGK